MTQQNPTGYITKLEADLTRERERADETIRERDWSKAAAVQAARERDTERERAEAAERERELLRTRTETAERKIGRIRQTDNECITVAREQRDVALAREAALREALGDLTDEVVGVSADPDNDALVLRLRALAADPSEGGETEHGVCGVRDVAGNGSVVGGSIPPLCHQTDSRDIEAAGGEALSGHSGDAPPIVGARLPRPSAATLPVAHYRREAWQGGPVSAPCAQCEKYREAMMPDGRCRVCSSTHVHGEYCWVAAALSQQTAADVLTPEKWADLMEAKTDE